MLAVGTEVKESLQTVSIQYHIKEPPGIRPRHRQNGESKCKQMKTEN